MKRPPLALGLAMALLDSCVCMRRTAISMISNVPDAPAPVPRLRSEIDGRDVGRPRVSVTLMQAVGPFVAPTDVQYVPGQERVAIILEQTGAARWGDLADGSTGTFFEVEVLTDSEEGLLGLAFHPRFRDNGRFFINAVVASSGKDVSRISEWTVPPASDVRRTRPTFAKVILEVVQPYQNHNAGQLAFGPDGMLYVGWGDGGYRADPHGNGQNPMTMLGSMLRIDVDRAEGLRGYGIPPDNPFASRKGALPETWAWGLRNPWRYSFDPRGRLIVADVGQDAWEEIDIVERGKNYGWNVREGRHCFEPSRHCRTEGLVDPIYEYGRDEGQSVTGGYVYTGRAVPALAGKYVFGDFATGRLWALDLPEASSSGSISQPAHEAGSSGSISQPAHEAGSEAKVHALGRWPIAPSTFGRDARGEVYVADFASGWVFAIAPPAR